MGYPAPPAGPGLPAADALTGLGSEEAARRLARDGPNVLPSRARRGWRAIVWQAAREPMFVLLFAAGLLYLLLGEPREGILMFALVVATPGMALYEESKAGLAATGPPTGARIAAMVASLPPRRTTRWRP